MENLISINSLRLKSYEGGLDKNIINILEITNCFLWERNV